jgi:hypothetical protein
MLSYRGRAVCTTHALYSRMLSPNTCSLTEAEQYNTCSMYTTGSLLTHAPLLLQHSYRGRAVYHMLSVYQYNSITVQHMRSTNTCSYKGRAKGVSQSAQFFFFHSETRGRAKGVSQSAQFFSSLGTRRVEERDDDRHVSPADARSNL